MDKFLDILAGWDRMGQWLFFCFVVLMIAVTISEVFKFIAIMLRGWPPVVEEPPEEQQEEAEGE
jgi:hypothetical protein